VSLALGRQALMKSISINKMAWLSAIILPVFAVIIYVNYKWQPSPIGFKSDDFPDKEVCSLACGVGWETYCTFRGSFTTKGWDAKINDEINWVIDKTAKGTYRFDGLYFDGDEITGLEMKLNKRILKGELHNCVYRIDKDEYVKAGDVISVVILSTKGNGHVNSIQPNGVH
jgi:hypothetical protein